MPPLQQEPAIGTLFTHYSCVSPLCHPLTPAPTRNLYPSVAFTKNKQQVLRKDLETFLLTHPDRGLRSMLPELLGADMPDACGWGEAVGYLRESSRFFVDLNQKV